MDLVMSDLKKMGFEDKDLESNYSIYPEYNYTSERGQELKGYRVTNNVQIKIRDLSKIPSVLALPGKDGATQVGGLTFTIDDSENLKVQARDKAVVDAERKASKLATLLGVNLIEIITYNEFEAGPTYPPYPMYATDMGGGPEKLAVQSTIASGSQDVAMNVSITYKIAPQPVYQY